MTDFAASYFTLQQQIRSGGTFKAPLPDGLAAADVAASGHKIITYGTFFEVGDDFTLAAGGSDIAITWTAATTLPAGTQGVLSVAIAEPVPGAADVVVSGFNTLTDLRAAIDAEEISADVTAVATAAHTTPGDGGGAAYAWQSTAPSWAALDPGNLLHFPDTSARGGYWALTNTTTRPEVAGAVSSLLGNPASCAVAAINTLLAVHNARGGGTVDVSGGRSYGVYTAPIVVLTDTNLIGDWRGGDRRGGPTSPPDWAGATRPFPTFVVDTDVVPEAIIVRPNATVRRIAGRRRNMTTSPGAAAGTAAVQRWAQDEVRGIAGTFIRAGTGGGVLRGNDSRVEEVFAIGFNIAYRGAAIPRAHIKNIFGDGNTLVQIDSAGDVVYASDWEHFPFITLAGGAGSVTRKVTALADNGGKVQLTFATTHTTAITEWNSGAGGRARVALADGFQFHVEAGGTVTIAGLTGPAAALNGTQTVYSVNNDQHTSLTLTASYTADLVGQTGTFSSAAPDLSYLRVGDRLYLQNWSSVDPLTWSGHTVSVVGGLGTLTSSARYVHSAESSTQITLTMAWDAALAAETCVASVLPHARDGIGFNLSGADGIKLTRAFVKGPVVGYFLNSSPINVVEYGYEPGATGESPVEDPGTVGVWAGPNAARLTTTAGAIKSAGRQFVSELTINEGWDVVQTEIGAPVVYSCDLREGKIRFTACDFANGTPRFNFGAALTPANKGVWLVNCYVPEPVLTVDAASSQDAYRFYHAFVDATGGEWSLWGAIHLRNRKVNWGGGLNFWSSSGSLAYTMGLGSDDTDTGDLASFGLLTSSTNNPSGNFIIGSAKGRTTPLDVTLYASRALGAAADGDEVARLNFRARNAADAARNYLQLGVVATTVAAGSEATRVDFRLYAGGSVTTPITIDGTDGLTGIGRLRSRMRQIIVSSGTQALTYVDHQDVHVILRGGGISFNAATQGAGFAFTIVNRQGTDWTISGITGASAILDTSGATPTAIAAGGVASVIVQPDASTGVEVLISGNTV